MRLGALFYELHQFLARNSAHKELYFVSTAKEVIRRMTIPLQKYEFYLQGSLSNFSRQAFLWFKSVEVANKEAEDQDRRDGYL